MKLFIVGRQEWETTDRKTGEVIEGLSYIAYTPANKVIKFTSLEEYIPHEGSIDFDPKEAVEVNLIVSLFGGEVKYKDGASYGKKDA